MGLSETISPLKTYSRKISAQVDYDKNIDFKSLKMAGFDSVGMIAPDVPDHDHGILMESSAMIKDFISRANKHLFNSTFVIGVDHPALAVEAFASGAYYAAGQAVHSPVDSPLEPLHFENHAFFRLWKGEAV